jgi:N-acyl-D-amino-acid deacylase
MRARPANGGHALVAAIAAVGLFGCATTAEAAFDILITGGQVLDGTWAQTVRVDVGIRGDRLVEIGALAGRPAGRTLDASGLVVAPGFIDLHTLAEMPLPADGAGAGAGLRHPCGRGGEAAGPRLPPIYSAEYAPRIPSLVLPPRRT